MGKKLVVVESPGKIRTIQKFLGSDYIVKASVGHCFEIDPAESAIDMKNGFEPKYIVSKGKKEIVNELKELSKKCDICYICTDPDREGEAIGMHIAKALDKKAVIKRASFNEITQSAVLRALQCPREMDVHLYHAQQARAVLDRLVGYKVSPFLWRYVASKTSAGRVQSIGLRFIVDRQKEIDDFKIEEYWTIAGDFSTPRKEKFTAAYTTKEKHKNKADTDCVLDTIRKVKKWTIKEVTQVKKDRAPFPVFETSSLQQFCSSTFGWSSKRTMGIAQDVYEKGLITYHRTDSTNISTEAIDAVRILIPQKFGAKYLPAKPIIYKSKGNAQEAHEGIRPSHIEITPEEASKSLEADGLKLYEAVYGRFFACQMTRAEFNHTKVTVESDDTKHTFTASGQILLFDGFLKAYPYASSKETLLPTINKDEVVKLESVLGEQHFTKPPAAFNDGSLVKTLKEQGIGRPSTYASIIETLKKRLYVEDSKKVFTPTELGKRVCDFLAKAFPESIMNPNYTARIEEQLDEIADNKKVWNDVVGAFWTELEKCLQASKQIGTEIKQDNVTDFDCPTCKKNKLVKRFGRFGPFYGCNGFRAGECKAMFSIGEKGEPVLIEKKEKKYLEGVKCKCGGKVVIRASKKTGKEFGGCENFPKCKKIYTMEGELIEFKKEKEEKEES